MGQRGRAWWGTWAVLVALGPLAQGAKAPEERKPFSVRDVTAPTAHNVGAALRERVHIPEPVYPPDRLFMLGGGVGLPNLASVELSLQVLRRLQLGASVGIVPGGSAVFPLIPLPEMRYTLPDNNDYALNPVASTSMDAIVPFLRYFPTHRTTYLQLSWTMIRTHHNIVSPLKSVLLDAEVPGTTITANVDITHTLPTLSIGHIFWRRLFFVNLSIGASFVLSSQSSTTISTQIPDPLGSIVASQPNVFDDYAQSMDQMISANVASVRDTIGIIPSILISAGLMF